MLTTWPLSSAASTRAFPGQRQLVSPRFDPVLEREIDRPHLVARLLQILDARRHGNEDQHVQQHRQQQRGAVDQVPSLKAVLDERGLGAVEVADEGADAALVEKLDALVFLVPGVGATQGMTDWVTYREAAAMLGCPAGTVGWMSGVW